MMPPYQVNSRILIGFDGFQPEWLTDRVHKPDVYRLS